MEVTICVSITLQIEQIDNTPNEKKVNFAKLQRKKFFHIYWSSGVRKSHMIIL